MTSKTIHFVWLRHEGMSERLAACVKSWKAHHPSWTVRVWGRGDITEENFTLKPWIDACASGASKAELMSYEIVYRHGGVFTVVDMECVKSVDQLLANEDAHALIVCDDGKDRDFCTNTWFAASRPENPLLGKLLASIKSDTRLLTHLKSGDNLYDYVGPKLFGRLYTLCCDNEKDGKLIVLPRVCFYPYDWVNTDPRDMAGPFPHSYGVCLWSEWWKSV